MTNSLLLQRNWLFSFATNKRPTSRLKIGSLKQIVSFTNSHHRFNQMINFQSNNFNKLSRLNCPEIVLLEKERKIHIDLFYRWYQLEKERKKSIEKKMLIVFETILKSFNIDSFFFSILYIALISMTCKSNASRQKCL